MTGWKIETNEEYHSPDNPEHPVIGSSGLSVLTKKTPAHYKYGFNGPKPETAIKGTLVHLAVLEPERYKRDKIFAPLGNRSTKPVKMLWEKFFEDLDEKGLLVIPVDEAKKLKANESHLAYNIEKGIVVTDKQDIMVNGIMKSIRECNTAMKLLEGNYVTEQSGYIEVEFPPESGVFFHVKIRPDVMRDDGIVVDLKKTTDCLKFNRSSIQEFDYDLQAALYLDVISQIENETELRQWRWITVEEERPWGVMVFDLDEEVRASGLEKYMKGLRIFSECLEFNFWPCYEDKVYSTSLPAWRENELYGGEPFKGANL